MRKRISNKALFFLGGFLCSSVLLIYVIPRQRNLVITERILTNSSPLNPEGLFDRQPEKEGIQLKTNFTAVVIVTYMRSGSSLTGDILQQSPGAFYVYEPLHALGHIFKKLPGTDLEYVNGTIRQWPFDFRAEAVEVIRNWLICDVDRLPKRTIMDGFLNKGIRSKAFRICYNQQRNLTSDSTFALKTCAAELKTLCLMSTTRILKTIRMPLNWIRHLLDELPELKIVHLIRDPRATLHSQLRLGMCSSKHGGVIGCSLSFCERHEKDLKEGDDLSSGYPGRLIRVFYENIARRPIEASKLLFNFTGAAYTSHVQGYVYNITLAGNPNNCAICTTRSNSSAHIDSWKRKINTVLLNEIENRCNFILRRYNYTINSSTHAPMTTEEFGTRLRDSWLPGFNIGLNIS